MVYVENIWLGLSGVAELVGVKKKTKEIMMMWMTQIHCTYRETTYMYIPWMPLFRHIPLRIERIKFELNVKRILVSCIV